MITNWHFLPSPIVVPYRVHCLKKACELKAIKRREPSSAVMFSITRRNTGTRWPRSCSESPASAACCLAFRCLAEGERARIPDARFLPSDAGMEAVGQRLYELKAAKMKAASAS